MSDEARGEGLPVEAARDDVLDALDRDPVVVTAPTGSGKSSLVPSWCADAVGSVLVVEPRRVACRSLGRWVARLRGGEPGAEVGWRHRHEDRSSGETRILFATPGTALRMLHAGDLEGWGGIVVDEFHERHLQVDLFLALLRERHPDRPLVVMSATVDAGRIAGWLGGEVVRVGARQHPVEIEHDREVSVPTWRGLADRAAAAVRRALERDGDVLVFLPGKAEIAAIADRLRGLRDVEVMPLHGNLGGREQDRVFDPRGPRRVVLSTNVAESAVTIPRVGVVVDGGLERRTVWRDDRSVLELSVISRASADQRAGRAGRLGPGLAVRLWSPAARLEPHTPPEILRVGLESAALMVASHGLDMSGLGFPDPPRDHAVREAGRRLRAMGALDGSGRITTAGREMLRLPLDAPLARVVVAARESGDGDLLQDAVDLAASLGTGRDLIASAPREAQGRRGRGRGEDGDPDAVPGEDRWPGRSEIGEARCDFVARILAVRIGDPGRHGLVAGPLSEARRVAARLRSILGISGTGRRDIRREALARLVLAAWPDSGHVAHARAGAFGNGRAEVVLARESLVSASTPALVVLARRSVRRKGRTVTMATCASPASLEMICDAGLGAERLVRAGWSEGRLEGTIERVHAGQVICASEGPLEGRWTVPGAARSILSGDLLPGAGERLQDDVDAWNLHRLLEGRREPPVDAVLWLEDRLRALGVASPEDLVLVSGGDLEFPGLDAEVRERLDRDWPRTIDLGRQQVRVTYDPARREVTIEPTSGADRTPPTERLLPPWPRWGVLYRDRGRIRRLR